MDHNYSVPSQIQMKRKLDIALDELEKCKKKIKVEHQKVRRQSKKIHTLSNIVKELKRKTFISDSCADLLESCLSGIPLQIMKRFMSNTHSSKSKAYHPLIQAFALTLNFYSTKAYNFVRETFGLNLPHISTLKRWCGRIDGNPGFTKQAFSSLKRRVEEENERGKDVLCSLMLDEMSIKKHVEWNGEKMVGFVDIGTGITDESSPIATDALVFMAVCVNGSWKVPIGYFLINGLNGSERANLVIKCIQMLNDVGVIVISLTCDGPSCHISMLKELGASMDPNHLDPSFPHPSLPQERVYVLLDICHMLKLLRNTFASCGIMKDGSNNRIEWNYIQELNRLQEKEGLRLANKIKSTHIYFHNQKMKVNLAAQILSKGVADALLFCKNTLHLPQFNDCQGTADFLYIANDLFDVLNSRNKFARGMKGALKPETENRIVPFLDKAYSYFASIKDSSGITMCKTQKKTPFIGFMAAIISVKAIYKKYVCETKQLDYLLTHKLSQDHLELFFCAIRASGGFRNNPSASQFMSSYKKLFLRHEIKGSNGNVTINDMTKVLTYETSSNIKSTIEDSTENIIEAKKYDLIPTEDHDYANCSNSTGLSEYKEAVVGYIAGHVVKMVKRSLSCTDCLSALTTDVEESDVSLSLILTKDNGGLVKPSKNVVKICLFTENIFQKMLNTYIEDLSRIQRFPVVVAYSVLKGIGRSVFSSFEYHMFDSEPDDNHFFSLVKSIVFAYCKIRMHNLVKDINCKIRGHYVRKTLSKLILFKNQ